MHRREYIGALVFTNRYLADIDPTRLGSEGYNYSYRVMRNVLNKMKNEVKDESKVKK